MCKLTRGTACRISGMMTSIDGGNAEANVRLMHRDRHDVFDNREIADFLVILREKERERGGGGKRERGWGIGWEGGREERETFREYSLVRVTYLYVIKWSSHTVCKCEEIATLMLFVLIFLRKSIRSFLFYRACIIRLMMIFVSKIRYANLRAAFARRICRAITFENSTVRACESSRGDATVQIMSAICSVHYAAEFLVYTLFKISSFIHIF